MQDPDSLFPALSDLASASGGTTLAALASSANTAADQLLTLAGCCHWVLAGYPSDDNVADPFGYLKTVDEMLVRFVAAEANRESLWRKLSAPGSSFLDTVAEAALSVHLRLNGQSVQIERPFLAGEKRSKDADVVIQLPAGPAWLDVLSIQPQVDILVSDTPYLLRTSDELMGDLERRFRSKYDSKFRDAVKSGAIGTSLVGVCVCLVKYEQALAALLPLMMVANGAVSTPPPSTLFSACPNLAIAWAFTLRKAPGSDLLHPVWLVKWSTSAAP